MLYEIVFPSRQQICFVIKELLFVDLNKCGGYHIASFSRKQLEDTQRQENIIAVVVNKLKE